MSISLVWKEAGLGSQHKLAQVKRELSQGTDVRDRKGIGHCGTLDPFAEGILCVGVGEGTKILSALVGLSKTYVVEMILGATTLTYDSESELELSDDPEVAARLSALTCEGLAQFLATKIGRFEQIPPQHSAVKVAGRRAFDYARSGLAVELKPRTIEVLAAQPLDLRDEEIEGHSVKIWRFEVSVSSGTYIRAFARDWSGELIGMPGTLKTLVRSRLGPWQMSPGSQRIELDLADFRTLIPTLETLPERAEALRSYGRWDPSWVQAAPGMEAVRGFLLVNPERPTVPVALLTPERAVQRVFNSNPFA